VFLPKDFVFNGASNGTNNSANKASGSQQNQPKK